MTDWQPSPGALTGDQLDKTPGRPQNGPLSPAERVAYRELELALNRRAEVETVLWSVSIGKRELLTPDECRVLAAKLGTNRKENQ